MRIPMQLSEVQLKAATEEDQRSGLLGWITVTLNKTLRLDGIALRRTLNGRYTLSFPYRNDKYGTRHDHVRPLNEHVRHEFERQVFAALGYPS